MAGLVHEAIAVPSKGPNIVKSAAKKSYDYLVVGAGFAGSVIAERLASQHDAHVLVVDRRPHVGGNAYDHLDEAGVLIHQYGPHIFHTNSDEIVDYLSQFTEWRPYEHKVLAEVRGQLVPIPINRTTLNMLFGLDLKTDEEAAAYLASRAETVEEIRTSEDVVINAVGRELYELFFQGYTRKQWGIDPSGLDKAVTARIPTRTNTDDRYFGDKHQIMPRDGYTAMFNRMLDHPNIDVLLSTDYKDIGRRDRRRPCRLHRADRRIFRLPLRQAPLPEPPFRAQDRRPGPVPAGGGGELSRPAGALHADHRVQAPDRPEPRRRPASPTNIRRRRAIPITRSRGRRTRRCSRSTRRWRTRRPDVTFVGRLATYRYYNMDQVVGQALAAFRRLDAARRPKVGARSGSIWTEAAE